MDLLEADGGGLLVEDLVDRKVYPPVGFELEALGEPWLEVKPGDLDAAVEAPLGHLVAPAVCLVVSSLCALLELQCLLLLLVLLVAVSTRSERGRPR